MKKVVRAFWTGANPMSADRTAALLSMRENIGADLVDFRDASGIRAMVAETGVPLHPAYKYLQCNHQSDYLRCYACRFLGGGYADVKFYSRDNNWRESLATMAADPGLWVVGQPETAGGSPFREFNRPPLLDKLVCNGFFVVREDTEFSRRWFEAVTAVLDANHEALARHPAQAPRDPRECRKTGYPLRWADLQGRPFHLLLAALHDARRVARTLRSGCDMKRSYL